MVEEWTDSHSFRVVVNGIGSNSDVLSCLNVLVLRGASEAGGESLISESHQILKLALHLFYVACLLGGWGLVIKLVGVVKCWRLIPFTIRD
jgi:hypothetical protein